MVSRRYMVSLGKAMVIYTSDIYIFLRIFRGVVRVYLSTYLQKRTGHKTVGLAQKIVVCVEALRLIEDLFPAYSSEANFHSDFLMKRY